MKRKLTVFGLIAFLTIPFAVAVTTSLNQRFNPVDAEARIIQLAGLIKLVQK